MALDYTGASADSIENKIKGGYGNKASFGRILARELGSAETTEVNYSAIAFDTITRAQLLKQINDYKTTNNKLYRTWKTEYDGMYMIHIKHETNKHKFTPLVRVDTEPMIGNKGNDTVSKNNIKYSSIPHKKLLLATNGAFFLGKYSVNGGVYTYQEGTYSTSAVAPGTHHINGYVYYKDNSNVTRKLPFANEAVANIPKIGVGKIQPIDSDAAQRTIDSSKDFYAANITDANSNMTFSEGNPNLTQGSGAIGGLKPLIMTLPGGHKLKYGTRNRKLNGAEINKGDLNSIRALGGEYANYTLNDLSEKSNAYWSDINENTSLLWLDYVDYIGYNILAYDAVENISILIVVEHKTTSPGWEKIRDRLFSLGMSSAVSFDNSSSTFLFDYETNTYVFTAKEKGKFFSEEIGYGFSV